MNLDLITVQRGVPATAVICVGEDYKKLNNAVIMKSESDSVESFGVKLEKDIYKKMIEEKKAGEIVYFIIKDIDKVSIAGQSRCVSLVKDREFMNYKLPENCILVFTVKEKTDIRNVIKELYKFCFIA